MDGPLKAMCQESRNSYDGEDLFLLKISMFQRVAPHYHSLAPNIITSSSKVGCFSPPGKIVWQGRGRIGCPSHHQGCPSLISLIWHVGPWHPTCGIVAPWKPKCCVGFVTPVRKNTTLTCLVKSSKQDRGL
jgi:hypothetical protein